MSTPPAPKKKGVKIGIIAAAVVVVLLVVIGVATKGFGFGGVQPKEAVDVPAASQEQSAEGQGATSGLPVKSAVEAYTWDELSQISAEIAAAGDEAAGIEVAKKYNLCTPEGKLDGTQVKSVTLTDGTQTTVQIIGFNHDDKTGGGKAGITFLFGDVLSEAPIKSGDTNAGGWESSPMRSYLAGDMLLRLPDDLKSVIVPVDKSTNNVGAAKDYEKALSSVSATSDTLWLPSLVELYGSKPFEANEEFEYTNQGWFDGYGYDSEELGMSGEEIDAVLNGIIDAEGSEYSLFAQSKVVIEEGNCEKEVLEKALNGEPKGWWTRSPYPAYAPKWYSVDEHGAPSEHSGGGVVPGFCI